MMFRAQKSLLPKAAAAAAALSLVLTGCGSSPEAASDGPVTLRFSWWGSDVRHKMTEKLIEAFEAENPNINIEGEYGDWLLGQAGHPGGIAGCPGHHPDGRGLSG